MGQCTSRKATGSLTKSTFVSHIKPLKMDKSNNKGTTDEENRKTPVSPNENTHLVGTKKTQPKHSKGVAMSFGFKRRPIPKTTTNRPANRDHEDLPTSTNNDPNGNRDETANFPTRNQPVKDRTMHKTAYSQKPNSTTPRPSRFGFHQATSERTNKVADIKPVPSPVEFGGGTTQKRSILASPTSPQDGCCEIRTRTFTRSASRTGNTERSRIVNDNIQNRADVGDRLGGTLSQMGKFTFQTTRLPQPEPIRVMETKTAKTIANQNKRSARMRRQYEEGRHLKAESLTEDSGFGSNTSGYLGELDHTGNLRYIDSPLDDNRTRENMRNNLSIMENSDSLSETGTPPPLPKLPPAFTSERSERTNTEKEYDVFKEKYNNKRDFIKLSTQKTFLKSRTEADSSPHSSSDHDWSNAGEAMAEDTNLLLSPIHTIRENRKAHQNFPITTSATIVGAALHTLVKPSVSLELTQTSIPLSKNFSLDEDPVFTAVAGNNKIGHLLDEEVLSPVESLLSCSETDDILKKKLTNSSSNSKDINEKLTPTSPEPPSNGTYSLSLSEDKEDFLIDDEIADQPELVFEDGIGNCDESISSFFYQTEKNNVSGVKDSLRGHRARSYEVEASPRPSRKKRDFLNSINESFDSLSPCESIGSDDLMLEFDSSLNIDVNGCDRRSDSYSSLDDASKLKFKAEDAPNNKNSFRSSPLKPLFSSGYKKESPRLNRRFSYQSSPERRSPKHTAFNQALNYQINQLGYQSVAYDPASECLMLTRANHTAIQQDIIGIKTMLLTLKRVLNESETQHSLNSSQDYSYDETGNQNINNNNEFKMELADLRRQVLFLQGQLEDKEKTVSNLQEKIDDLAIHNNQPEEDNPVLTTDIQIRCNAATQTERVRPISSGTFSLTGSPMDENVRLLVK